MQITNESQIINNINDELDLSDLNQKEKEEIYQISLDVLETANEQGSIYLDVLLRFYRIEDQLDENFSDEDYAKLLISFDFLGIDRVEEIIIISSFNGSDFIINFQGYVENRYQEEWENGFYNDEDPLFDKLFYNDYIRTFILNFQKFKTIEESAAYYDQFELLKRYYRKENKNALARLSNSEKGLKILKFFIKDILSDVQSFFDYYINEDKYLLAEYLFENYKDDSKLNTRIVDLYNLEELDPSKIVISADHIDDSIKNNHINTVKFLFENIKFELNSEEIFRFLLASTKSNDSEILEFLLNKLKLPTKSNMLEILKSTIKIGSLNNVKILIERINLEELTEDEIKEIVNLIHKYGYFEMEEFFIK